MGSCRTLLRVFGVDSQWREATFVRFCRMWMTPRSKSTSSQRRPKASPERTPVKRRKRTTAVNQLTGSAIR